MQDTEFDQVAREELRALEDAFAEVDPDVVDVSSSDGVLKLALRDGTTIVINSHRAARQIWMAAVASAWHFDPPAGAAADPGAGGWRSARSDEELRATLARVVRERTGLELPL